MMHSISVRTPIGSNTSKTTAFTRSQQRCSVISTRSHKASTRTITTRNNTLLRDTSVIFPQKIGSQFKTSLSHITPLQTKATTNNLFQKYSEQFNLTTTTFNDRISNQNILLKATNTTSYKKPNLNTPFNSFKGKHSLTSKTVLQPQSIPFSSRISKRDLSWDTTLTAYDEWFVNNVLHSLPVTWTADAAVWVHNTRKYLHESLFFIKHIISGHQMVDVDYRHESTAEITDITNHETRKDQTTSVHVHSRSTSASGSSRQNRRTRSR
jgi:hypothetical protein